MLVVLDGWGLSVDQRNILNTTELPTINKMSAYYPFVALQASGIAVGLPWGEPGNSEVGHMTMGAGRIIYQNLPRISLAIQNESFFVIPAFTQAVDNVKKTGGTLHLMGLLSSGSVHSHYDHLIALLELAKRNNLDRVAVHVFTDGRDSSPTSGAKMVAQLTEHLKSIGIGRIATVAGRHWAMDRNNNWERTEKTYETLTDGRNSPRATEAVDFLKEQYRAGTTDEFIVPTVIQNDPEAAPTDRIRDGDSVIFFNFREDRARQLTKAFVQDDFDGFERKTRPRVFFVTMTQYDKTLSVPVAFAPQKINDTLGEVLSKNGKSQLRIAETEKYAHVTYFFNGGTEKSYPLEERILVPSPTVPHFDEAPEMSAAEITEKIVDSVENHRHDFILANYANADMVGHTGNEKACREAVRAIDKTLSILIPAVLRAGGALLITADHGNVEVLFNYQTGGINTEHSTNPVPLWFLTADNHRAAPREKGFMPQVVGLLSDVAPTVLALFGIPKPGAMHGQNLLPLFKQRR